MSVEERSELTALVNWMQTFPQLENFTRDKENGFDILHDPSAYSSLFDVALEISNNDENETTMYRSSSDVWENIIALTRKTSKRKNIESSSDDTSWKDLSKHTALINLLDGAVSHPNIELRTTYVGRIMKLPAETQRSLMALIERGKKQSDAGRNKKKVKTAHATTDNNTSTPAKTRTTPRLNKRIRKPSRSPFSAKHTGNSLSCTPGSKGRALFLTPSRRAGTDLFSPGLGDTAEYEKEVQNLREQKDQLSQALESYRHKEEDLTRKLGEMQTYFRNEMMKVEAASRRREEESREELQSKINYLEQTLEAITVQSEETHNAQEELARMKDEMELMFHTKSMLDDTTEKLNHCKEKLQHLTDVKEALQREEEAHGRSVDENLRLQNELNLLQPLKRQLEEYKARVADAEFRLTDTQDELTKVKQQQQNKYDTDESLEMTLKSQQEEIEALRTRLKQEEEAQAAGLGEGMSELNPELKEELLRLRNENIQLKAFAQKREHDAVAKLEQNVDDSTRLCERYKSQFLSTKGQLETTQDDLKASLGREQGLEGNLLETRQILENTQVQLEKTTQELVTCSSHLDASQERGAKLEEELALWVEQSRCLQERTDDLTGRLQKCSKELEDSLGRETMLESSVAEWNIKFVECSEKAETQKINLEQRLQELASTLEGVNVELETSKAQATTAENLAEWLREELSDAREALSESQENESNLTDQLDLATTLLENSTHLMYAFEDEVDEVKLAISNAEANLEQTLVEKAQMEEDLQTELSQAQVNLEEERKLANMHKEELSQTQEILKETESSLGAAEHREKMLQLKLALLQDNEDELKAEIEAEKKKADYEMQEINKSLEATCEALKRKATKDLDDLQNKMNQLLEDEREAKHQVEEACQEKITTLQEKFNNESTHLRETAASDIEAAKKEASVLMEKMKSDFEEELTKVKQEADDESTRLVRKGKEMMKELKAKQQEETDKLKDEIAVFEEKYSVAQRQKESMTKQYKAKSAEYKKKLHFASGRINRLSAESDEYEEKVKALEREKFKLREENDRYRKQLGGRFGSESNGQVDLLQKELENACDEIRELKRQQRAGGKMASSSLPSIDEGMDPEQSYSRDVANHSTISQLRSEYEETIQSLVNDKRELVMRNSASITDVQKAEKRAWEAEQENATLKKELTSLKLQVERFESVQYEVPNKGETNNLEDDLSRDEIVEQESGTSPSQDESPSHFGLGHSSTGEDQPPECQQS